MNSKRLVLTILLLAAGVAPIFAQQSAQATMKVQVTVIEGNSITMNQHRKVTLNNSEAAKGLSELSTIHFSREPGSVFTMKRQERMSLIDNNGTNLELPVIYNDRITDRGITSELNISTFVDTSLNKGTFKGTLTTSVAYL